MIPPNPQIFLAYQIHFCCLANYHLFKFQLLAMGHFIVAYMIRVLSTGGTGGGGGKLPPKRLSFPPKSFPKKII